MVRPEQLDVRAYGDGDEVAQPGASIAGRVEHCRYYGHDALLRDPRRSSPGVEPALLARVDGEQALPAGTRVTVGAHGHATPLG